MAYNSPLAIDSSAFSLLLRGDSEAVRFVSTTTQVAVPIVVIAELRAGFLHGEKTAKYGDILDDFLSSPHTITLNIESSTVPLYAEIYAYARARGKQLANNDIWIAALCVQHNYPLLTWDKDFDALPQVRRIRLN